MYNKLNHQRHKLQGSRHSNYNLHVAKEKPSTKQHSQIITYVVPELRRDEGNATHGEGDNGGGEGEEAVLGHALGEADEGAGDAEHDPPQRDADDDAPGTDEDHVVAPPEGLELQPDGRPVPRRRAPRRLHGLPEPLHPLPQRRQLRPPPGRRRPDPAHEPLQQQPVPQPRIWARGGEGAEG